LTLTISELDMTPAPARDADEVLLPAEAADIVRLKPATLAKLRCVGGGPSFVKIGGRVGYRRSALDAWLGRGFTRTGEYADARRHR
jgi:hypothetical protein